MSSWIEKLAAIGAIAFPVIATVFAVLATIYSSKAANLAAKHAALAQQEALSRRSLAKRGNRKTVEHPYVWDQSPDGQTRLVDPVLTVRAIPRLTVSHTYAPRTTDRALVYSAANGTYAAFMPPHRPTLSQIATSRYRAVYEVDLNMHRVQHRVLLPSADDAFNFETVVNMIWKVSDPARYVASGIRDVPSFLLAEFESLARPTTRLVPIERSAEAESSLQRLKRESEPIGSAGGLHVGWTASLSQEASSREFSRTVNDRIAQFEREMFRETEKSRIESQKAAFYQWHLDAGGITPFALHLAQHPEDSQLILRSLPQEHRDLIARNFSELAEILQEALASADEQKRSALRAIQDTLAERLNADRPSSTGSE
ncbi:hypothetical protein [Streptomyces sp. NPDC126514]|uniref:hypothetical protein n=1 Tax=Streptomyces sp. NPDC126514 TaxID=3155210 RepID=UPI003320BD64